MFSERPPEAHSCFNAAPPWPSHGQNGRRKKNRTPAPPDDKALQSDQRVEDLLGPIRDEHHLPGLIGAISFGNRLAAIGALGIRKIGSSQPMQVNDQMHLGSCTKAMTATMIGSLVEAGKLAWKSTLGSIFPEAAEQLHPQFQGVTLSQLLTHRAGLPHDGPWWHLPGATTTQKRHALLTSMLQKEPLSRPGSTYAYSNVGYALAALMAERVSGESWESLMQLAAVRAASHDDRGVRHTRRTRRPRSALGPPSRRPRHQANASGQRTFHGPGGHGPLLVAGLGQVRGAPSGR